MLKRLLLSLLLLTATLYATPDRYEVAKLYVAMFDRAPDNNGLKYWVEESGLYIEGIAQSFFSQDETQKKYPPGTTPEEFVTAVYDNLFNREPDKEGLLYWAEEIASGNIPRSLFVLAVIYGAQGDDAAIVHNKTTVGLYFAAKGLNDENDATRVMEGVTEDPATIEAARQLIDELVGPVYTTLADLEFKTLYLVNYWHLTGRRLYDTMKFNNTYIYSSEGDAYIVDELTITIKSTVCASAPAIPNMTYICYGLYYDGAAEGYGFNIDSSGLIAGNYEYSPTGNVYEIAQGVQYRDLADAWVTGTVTSSIATTKSKLSNTSAIATTQVGVGNISIDHEVKLYEYDSETLQHPTVQSNEEAVQKVEEALNLLLLKLEEN